MKKIFMMLFAVVTICIVAMLGATSASAATSEFAGGSGTADDPYLIETKEHLNNVRNYLDAHYKMISDIVFAESDFAQDGDFYNGSFGWIPIGTNSNFFSGVFDGNGYSIKNLYVNNVHNIGNKYVGLFGYNNGIIKNLTLMDANIYVRGMADANIYSINVWVGTVAGCSDGSILNCCSFGSVYATADNTAGYYYSYYNAQVWAGGIVGAIGSTGIVANCYNNSSVEAYSPMQNKTYAGGIAGFSWGSVSCSYNLGDISADIAGGIIGMQDTCGTNANCYYLDSAVTGVGSGTDTCTKCTLASMTQKDTFVGFDFSNTWEFNSNYCYPWPILKNGYVPTTPHTYDNYCDASCNVCEYIRTAPHLYKSTWNENDSQHWHECSACGESDTKSDHAYDNSCDTSCNICGYSRTTTHSYKTTWEMNSANHWHECLVCGSPDEKQAHTPGASATESTPQTCTTCGYVIKAALGHTHSYENEWTTNSGKHWHACVGCGDRKDESNHVFDNSCDTSCNTCGYVRAISHGYKTTWESDENQHWHICSVCSSVDEKVNHNYDNQYDAECNSCNHTRQVETIPDATTTLDETTEDGNTTMPNTTEPDVTIPDTTDGGKESGKKDDGNTKIIIIIAVASVVATAGIASAVFAVILKKRK